MTVGAIVLAGGVGSRMRPLTEDCPKPLLPLGAEPLVGYQLRRLARIGVRRVVVASGYLGDRFRAELGDGSRWGIELQHSVEQAPLGTGGAIRAAVDLLPEIERVVVVNGDLLSSHDLRAQLSAAAGADVCLHARTVPDVSAYGRIGSDANGRVHSFAEKSGSGSGMVNAGTYIARAGLLRSLPRAPSSWERDVLPRLIAGGSLLRAWTGAGYFRDVGDPAAYRSACVDAVTGGLPDAVPGDPVAYVDELAELCADSAAIGGSSVHAHAIVGARVQLVGSVLLPGCRVGASSRLVRCVVASGALVPAGSELMDTVVGRQITHR